MLRNLVISLLATACSIEQNLFLNSPPGAGADNPLQVPPEVQVDQIVQATNARSDVLFVVDNSPSMGQEQDELATNFPEMLGWLLDSGLDWHIGVVATDMVDPEHSGALRIAGEATAGARRWLEPTDLDPAATFGAMVRVGTDGAHAEQGRAATYTAIELLADTTNAGFVRDDAAMHIVVVSDENDASFDTPISLPDFVTFLSGFRWSAELVSFSSIVAPVGGCPASPSPGVDYLKITREIGGIIWPICSDDWGAALADLGFLGTGLADEFYLSRRPVPSTIAVTVTAGADARVFTAAEFAYDPARNSITFVDFVPGPLDVVQITYEVAAS